MRHKPPLPTRTLTAAKSLRTTSTDAEIKLWYHLRAKRLAGLKFRRQHPIPPYIADFFCPAKGLIVELDGDTHGPVQDRRRDARLRERGFETLRFINLDMSENIDGVVAVILAALQRRPNRWARLPHPNPSPEGEGLEGRA